MLLDLDQYIYWHLLANQLIKNILLVICVLNRSETRLTTQILKWKVESNILQQYLQILTPIQKQQTKYNSTLTKT